MDFEKLSVEGIARPWGWVINSYAQNVNYICDTTTVFSGKHSLRISNERRNDSNRFELSFFLEPNQILNSKIRVEGFAKAEDFVGKSGISIKSVGAIGEEYGTLKESEVEIINSKNWGKYAAEINIESQPHSVLVTLYFQGSGTVWFDRLVLKINNRVIEEIPVAPEFSREQLEVIAKNTTAFKTVEPVKSPNLDLSDYSDLEFLKSIVNGAKVIALGESTHGTSEFFKVKHRVLQYAILELGVRVFILEDNQLLVEKINEYVLFGKGDSSSVIKGLFAVWNTKEMLQLIEWIRSYNIINPKMMVEFVGMDVQNPQLALDHVNEFLKDKDTILQMKSNQFLTDINKEWRNSYFKEDSTLVKWDRDAKANFKMISNSKNKWLKESKSRSDSLKVEWAIKNARTIKQFVETALGGVYEGRDKAMAENVRWILNQRRPDTKALVWAHDSHISRGDSEDASSNFFFGKSMGSYLSKWYKDNYRAFGLFTFQGTCLGTISYSNFKQVSFEIYTSPVGSLDEVLHQISEKKKKNNLILNLQTFKNDSKKLEWIQLKRPVRYVGYVAEDYGFGGRYSIPFQFDGIIFIDKSSASSKID